MERILRRKGKSILTAEKNIESDFDQKSLHIEDIPADINPQNIELLFEKSFNYSSPCILFPVRHHSPACSLHLKKVISEYKPDAVLIEGPENAAELIDYIVSEKTTAPFCIYLSYDDKEGIINGEPDKYRAYYPFLSYSPEYIALKEARKQNIYCEFIDLSYAEKLINTNKKSSEDKIPDNQEKPDPEQSASEQNQETFSAEEHNSNDDLYDDEKAFTLGRFYEHLTEKTGCKSFNELWEMLFEINGCHEDTASFVKNLFVYCYYSRYYADQEKEGRDGLVREQVMKEHIQTAMKKYTRVLVVTGGMHTIALAKHLFSEQKTNIDSAVINITRVKKGESPAYLMPYSYEESDQASGYESGMVFPFFYQRVWENILKKKAQPFEEAVLRFIISTASEIRKKQTLSIADEMQSQYMARGLASLRDKKECGVFELIDSVKSSFIKGEINSFYQLSLKTLFRLMTGMAMGSIDSASNVPPIVTDFLNKCKKYKIATNSSVKKETKLDTYQKADHREKSRFFRQMQFLNTNFCSYLKSQEDNGSTGRILLRESWEYRCSPSVQAALISNSVYGGTLREACLNLLSKQLKENHHTAKDLAAMLQSAEHMGLSEVYDILSDQLIQVIGEDMDFLSVMGCFEQLNLIQEKMEAFSESNTNSSLSRLKAIIKLALNRCFTLVYTIIQIKDKEEEICKKIKYLYQFFIHSKQFWDKEEEMFLSAMQSVYHDSLVTGALAGVCSGVLLKKDMLTLEELFARLEAYIQGSEESKKMAASFLKGFFLTAKDIIFVDDRLLTSLNKILIETDGSLFLEILPDLRLAFTYFLPFEIDKIGKQVSSLFGVSTASVLYTKALNPTEMETAIEADTFSLQRRQEWFL